jgi:predicted nucleic-acid-binding Zn-ribbon protein
VLLLARPPSSHLCCRHATYTNQYRATAAVNCRVKKEELLTYTTSEGSRVPASLPFHKRKTLSAEGSTSAASTGQQLARLLQEDEFYAVACSDCGTMVGVFDRDQRYHFFNALPSTC